MRILYLFATFFKIGLFSIGGGLATLPFLLELADRSDWLTREMIGNMLAVAQSLPGPVGANLSAYTGFHYAWIPGSYTAVISLTIPSIIIILMVVRMLKSFKESVVVKNLFSGFRPAAAGLLSAAAFAAISLSLWNAAAPVWYELLRWKETLIFLMIFILLCKFKKHPIVYILIAGAAGLILKL